MTLFRRFLVFFLLAVLLPLVGVGLRVGSVTEQRLRQEAFRLQEGLAAQAATAVNETLNGYLNVLTITARQPLILEPTTYRTVLSSLLTRYPFLLDVALFTTTGRGIYALTRSPETGLGPLWDLEWGHDVLSTGWAVSDLEGEGGGATLRLAVVLDPGSGGPSGVLAARVSLVGLDERLQAVARAGGARFRLEDAGGRWVAGESVVSGEKDLVVRAEVPGFLWTIIWARPQSDVYSLARTLRRELRWALWIGAAVAVGLCLVLTRWLVGSLVSLEEALRDMKAGRFDRPPKSRGRDEIGRLATELREAQIVLARQVRQSTLGLLVHRVVHDLRHPLTVVRNSLEMIRHHVAGADAIAEKHFKLIDHELHRGAVHLEDLAVLGRTRELRQSIVDLNGLLKDVMAAWPLPADITLVWHLATDLPPGYYDDSQLRRAVINLVQNAQDAMSRGGRLTLGTAGEGGTQILSVEDEGEGVAAGDPAQIFQDFYSTKSGGTGLGLGIVQSVAEGHGGRVDVRRAEVRGTVFEIRLPRGRA